MRLVPPILGGPMLFPFSQEVTMSNRTKSAGRWVLGAVVLGVLALGAGQAAARDIDAYLKSPDGEWQLPPPVEAED